jgi:hypothetical protein
MPILINRWSRLSVRHYYGHYGLSGLSGHLGRNQHRRYGHLHWSLLPHAHYLLERCGETVTTGRAAMCGTPQPLVEEQLYESYAHSRIFQQIETAQRASNDPFSSRYRLQVRSL